MEYAEALKAHYDNVEAIGNAVLTVLEKAERFKQIRCIRQIRREHDEQKLCDNFLRFGRLGIGWAKRMMQKDDTLPVSDAYIGGSPTTCGGGTGV